MEFDELSNRVIACAIEVHWELGPGLLESTYEQCLDWSTGINPGSVRSLLWQLDQTIRGR